MTPNNQRLICDNPVCSCWVELEAKDLQKYINTPCPRCGENLLTESDFDYHLKLLSVIQKLPEIEESDKTEHFLSLKDGIFHAMSTNQQTVPKNKEWTLEGHGFQIADTGDVDGYYELSNGQISLITRDDIDGEDAARLTGILNEMDARWDSPTIDNLSYELSLEKKNSEIWKTLATKLYNAINVAGIEPKYDAEYRTKREYEKAIKNLP